MIKKFSIFAVVGILTLAIGVVAASPEPSETSEVTVTITATPDIVVAEQDVEGQEYIVQEDGTITIYLK